MGIVSAEVLLAVGAAALVLLLGLFLVGGKYRRPPKPLSPVEFGRARREAEGLMAGLAPRLMLLAERERAVVESLEGRGVEGRVAVERLVAEVGRSGVCEKFAVASAGVEEDPAKAIEELRSLPGLLDESLAKVGEAEKLSKFGVERSVGAMCGKESG